MAGSGLHGGGQRQGKGKAGEEEMKWKELNEKSQEKRSGHSAGRHTLHTVSGSSLFTTF